MAKQENQETDVMAKQANQSNVVTLPPPQENVVVELSKKYSKKDVKKLRRGSGKLYQRVSETIDDLRANGSLNSDVQTVVLIVREKSQVASSLLPKL